MAVIGEAQMSSCCVWGEVGMKEAQPGNRSSDHHDANCTASLRTAWGRVGAGCSSFSYKNGNQGGTPDRTQRF